MRHEISAELKMVHSAELEKSVAADLLLPDPIIPQEDQNINENSKKYDGRASGGDDITDLLSSCE